MVRPRFITAHILRSNFDTLQGGGELVEVIFGVLPDEFVLGLDEVEVISAAQGSCFDKVDGVLLTDFGGADALFGQALDGEALFPLCIVAAFVDEIHFGIRPCHTDVVNVFVGLDGVGTVVIEPDEVRTHTADTPDEFRVGVGLCDGRGIVHQIADIELHDIRLMGHRGKEVIFIHGFAVADTGHAEIIAVGGGVE